MGAMMADYRFRSGLRVEQVDHEILILDPAHGVVHRYQLAPSPNSDASDRPPVNLLVACDDFGWNLWLPATAIGCLLAAGLVEPLYSRRNALGVAGVAIAVGGVGLTAGEALVLPSAAHASSGVTDSGDPAPGAAGGTGEQPGVLAAATGGDVTDAGGRRIHSFTTSGLFVVSGAALVDVEILVVGGGGGGGGGARTSGLNVGSGGGGGGGVLLLSSQSLAVGSYQVVVGLGGAGGPAVAVAADASGSLGSSSWFGAYEAIGGGGGGGFNIAGTPGGSGGGGGGNSDALGGAGVVGQGNAGGASIATGTGTRTATAGGGGGGASLSDGIGGDALAPLKISNGAGGQGGSGRTTSITGSLLAFGGGGGGGGVDSAGAGGTGGGGAGSRGNAIPGVAGVNGLGGGGGGAGRNAAGGNGGSGVVVVAYPTG